jgi:deoxyribonuclease IV
MPRLGFHVSIAGSLLHVVPRALVRHCNTLQMFTSSPSQWRRKELDAEQARELRQRLLDRDLHPHFVHAIYLLNLASAEPTHWQRSVDHLTEELRRAEAIGAAGVVFHLGSVGAGGSPRAGVERVARALRQARAESGVDVPLVLENGAGGGNTLGSSLEEIAAIMEKASAAEPLRLCLDTAHAFAAGLPLHTERGLDQIATRLHRLLGRRRLALVHFNDSLGGFGLRRDRHWHLGQGQIGAGAMRRILNHPAWAAVPFLMETPGDVEDDRRNMFRARRWLPAEARPPLRRRPVRVP